MQEGGEKKKQSIERLMRRSITSRSKPKNYPPDKKEKIPGDRSITRGLAKMKGRR